MRLNLDQRAFFVHKRMRFDLRGLFGGNNAAVRFDMNHCAFFVHKRMGFDCCGLRGCLGERGIGAEGQGQADGGGKTSECVQVFFL